MIYENMYMEIFCAIGDGMKLIEKLCKDYVCDDEKEILEYGYEMFKTVLLGLMGAIIIAIIIFITKKITINFIFFIIN